MVERDLGYIAEVHEEGIGLPAEPCLDVFPVRPPLHGGGRLRQL